MTPYDELVIEADFSIYRVYCDGEPAGPLETLDAAVNRCDRLEAAYPVHEWTIESL